MQNTKNTGVKAPLSLAIDTSGRVGSVAIGSGVKIFASTMFSEPMRHSAELFCTIQTLLAKIGRKPVEVEHLYATVGPGSFTGLRIAVAMAKTMYLAANTKVVAISTSDVIAANSISYAIKNSMPINRIGTILDAKRGQFYIAVFEYQTEKLVKIVTDQVMTAEQFVQRFCDRDQPIWLSGEGLVYYAEGFRTEGIEILPEEYWSGRAENAYIIGCEMAEKGQFADPVTLEPFYLRRPEAEENRLHQK